jgi:hypothetical protein
MRRAFTACLLLAFLAAGPSGCAALFQNGPYRPNVAGDCDPAPASPILDIVWVVFGAIATVIGAVGVAANPGEGTDVFSPEKRRTMAGAFAAAGGVVALGFGGSAWWGFSTAARCRALRARAAPRASVATNRCMLFTHAESKIQLEPTKRTRAVARRAAEDALRELRTGTPAS